MQTLTMIAQVIAALTILVTIHELGHFLAARIFGIKVEKFFIFFDAWGKKIFSKKIGETEWGIGWLPLGGYVKIAGMIDESMDKESMKQPIQSWEFRSKPAWQRMIVMLGGIIFNVILGIVIFAGIKYHYGDQLLINNSLKYGIEPSELAQEVGFKLGDKIVSVNGKPIVHLEEALNSKVILGDNPTYIVIRNNQEVEVKLPHDFLNKLSRKAKGGFFSPRVELYVAKTLPNSAADKAGLKANDKIIGIDTIPFNCFDEFQPLLLKYSGKQTNLVVIRNSDTLKLNVAVSSDGKIGFKPVDINWKFDTIAYSIFSSIPAGINQAVETISSQISGWGKIFHGDIALNKAVQGPIGIAQFFGSTWDWLNFWMLTALISMALAFMNFLPIPALDGGHVVLLIIEMIIGRPVSDKWMERIQTVGMVILLSLMVLIFGNDIFQLIFK